MASDKAIRAIKSNPRKRGPRDKPTIRLSLSVPSKLVSELDVIASYFGVSRSYIVAVLLADPVNITSARIREFGDESHTVSEAMTRAIVGTAENQMDLLLDDRLQLLQEAVNGRDL